MKLLIIIIYYLNYIIKWLKIISKFNQTIIDNENFELSFIKIMICFYLLYFL